jgi:hypothetical protein
MLSSESNFVNSVLIFVPRPKANGLVNSDYYSAKAAVTS